MWPELGLILGAYLLGSLPLPYLIGRLRGFDLRHEYDHHISLWRKVGHLEGLIGILGDIAKGAIAVLVARALGFALPIVALCGLAAIVGEMWSVFLRFNGEKANTTSLGVAVALTPKALLIALIPIAIGALVRTVPRLLPSQPTAERLNFGGPPSLSLPLGMAIGFAVLPLAAWWLGQDLVLTLACLAIFLLIIVKRVTAGLLQDLKAAESKKSILINRILYDRSYR